MHRVSTAVPGSGTATRHLPKNCGLLGKKEAMILPCSTWGLCSAGHGAGLGTLHCRCPQPAIQCYSTLPLPHWCHSLAVLQAAGAMEVTPEQQGETPSLSTHPRGSSNLTALLPSQTQAPPAPGTSAGSP